MVEDEKLIARRIKALTVSAGQNSLRLASHAALPVALNPQFLHLLRVNFFLDPPECTDIDDDVEAIILLSPLCIEIGDGLYEIDAQVRPWLLRQLVQTYSESRLQEVASLLWQYSDPSNSWNNICQLRMAQLFSAASFLDPHNVYSILEMAENNLTRFDQINVLGSQEIFNHNWVIAMRSELNQVHSILSPKVTGDSDKTVIDKADIDFPDAIITPDKKLTPAEIMQIFLSSLPYIVRPFMKSYLERIVPGFTNLEEQDLRLVEKILEIYVSKPDLLREAILRITQVLKQVSPVSVRIALSTYRFENLISVVAILPWYRKLDSKLTKDILERLETIIRVVCSNASVGDLHFTYNDLSSFYSKLIIILKRTRYRKAALALFGSDMMKDLTIEEEAWALLWSVSISSRQAMFVRWVQEQSTRIFEDYPFTTQDNLNMLAERYDEVREIMPVGDNRTRKMWEIVGLMKVYLEGTSNYQPVTWCEEKSAGRRLAAIVALQLNPDPSLLMWLAMRFAAEESAFIKYQAGSALVEAAKKINEIEMLNRAIITAKEYLDSESESHGHTGLLAKAEEELHKTTRLDREPLPDNYRLLQRLICDIFDNSLHNFNQFLSVKIDNDITSQINLTGSLSMVVLKVIHYYELAKNITALISKIISYNKHNRLLQIFVSSLPHEFKWIGTLQIDLRVYHGHLILYLEGDLDLTVVQYAKQAVENITVPENKISMVNLSGLSYVDSSGLALFLTGLKRTREYNGYFALIGPQPNTQRILQITRLNAVIPVYDTADQAITEILTTKVRQ